MMVVFHDGLELVAVAGNSLSAHLQLEELEHVRPRNVRELVLRVQGFAQALEGAEGAQHEGECRREAERLVDGDGKEVLAYRLRDVT